MTTSMLIARCDRYLKIVNWARDRYTRNGHLPLLIRGEIAPWVYIEKLAYARYIA